jgi:Serine carboxypeptidase S28
VTDPDSASQLPIDHTDSLLGTYRNRYWVNDQFYQPGGPVFVHDVGENDAEGSAHRYLNDSASYLLEMLQEFHGIGIVWEHRYVYTFSQRNMAPLYSPLSPF